MILKIKGPDGQNIEIKSMEEALNQIAGQLGPNVNYNQLEFQIADHYRNALKEYGMNGGKLRDVDLPHDSPLLTAGVIDLAMKSPWNRPERDTILKLCTENLSKMGGQGKDIAGQYVKTAWNELQTYGPEHFSGDTIVQLMNLQAAKTQVDANGGSLHWNDGSRLLYGKENVSHKISAEYTDKIVPILQNKETPAEIKSYLIKMAYNSDLAKMPEAQRAELETYADKLLGKEYLESVDIFKLSSARFAESSNVNKTLDDAIEMGNDESLKALDIVNDVRKRGAANKDLQDKISAASDRIAQALAKKKALHELATDNMSTDNGIDPLAEKQNRKENLTETGLYEQRKKQKDTVLKNQNINIMKEQSQR